MTHERDNFPKHLTFSQRYGYEPLPELMRLEKISKDLRREIWNTVHAFFRERSQLNTAGTQIYFTQDVRKYIERVWGRFQRVSESRVSTKYNEVMENFESIITRHSFNQVLDLLEITIDEQNASDQLETRIERLFYRHASAYWLDRSQQPCRFVACASEEQGAAIKQAIAAIREGGMEGAATHLRQAVDHINAGQYADSIADGIHAVESVARMIDSKANKTLGLALKSLETAEVLKHPALREAFDKLYGYTNTEQGIRHALLDKGAADVGLDEAIFMFGACASFAAYLTEKHRRAGGA
ncbi:MAG: hypothetical protein OXC14_14165 [Rhodospirillaceae bacterium]|nr:hypothetical protein [Rhodospirillaceae bacterium]